MPNIFFNKYPNTNFHELDLTFVLTHVKECIDAVEDFETRLTADEAEITEHDGRLDVLEAWKTVISGQNLDSRLSVVEAWKTVISGQNLNSRLLAVENSEIMDAELLSDAGSVTPSASNVNLAFTKRTYTNGVKTAESADNMIIPAATTSNAGVMIPADKLKLAPITASGNDLTFAGDIVAAGATFSGPASGVTPVSSGDLATKGYCDSLAITGTATVSEAYFANDVIKEGSTEIEYGTVKIRTYGKVAEMGLWFSHEFAANHGKTTTALNATLPEQYRGGMRILGVGYKADGTIIPFEVHIDAGAAGSGTCKLNFLPVFDITAGDSIKFYLDVTYLMIT